MRQVYLSIAGLTLLVRLHDEWSSLRLPASYEPFMVAGRSVDPVLTLNVRCGENCPVQCCEPVASGMNDLGETRLYVCDDSYVVNLSPRPGCGFRTMTISRDFKIGELTMPAGDVFAVYTVDSMLRILFSQAVVAHNAFMLHSAAVVHRGCAVLLMGKSGTGKSTHARLWMNEFDNTELLNDDNPVVRVLPSGIVMAYGSPWSGKTACYRQAFAPVKAFVRLEQAKVNEFSQRCNIDAFVAILPGVSVITHSKDLYSRVCSTVIEAAARTVVGSLRCLPDADAARKLRMSLF
ncbi:MAG: hypothetical protein K2O88_01610 [Paramuribaculum sp.]|nr:hypothetical protein [Paramuribaculum sp.]